jgi:hypothetical protein
MRFQNYINNQYNFHIIKYMHYGFSIWYIPYNFKKIMEKYNIIHVPHVTYKTNIDSLNQCQDLIKNIESEIFISFQENIYKFPKMHKNDPLFGCGWYIDINDCSHEFDCNPHLTQCYFNNYKDFTNYKIINYDKPEDTACYLTIVDTRSNNPSEWIIIEKIK